jgi:hypothetical protein
MYNSFITLFYSVYNVWYIVSYLLYLFAYMYLCNAIDDAQFEDQQDQAFEDTDPLIIFRSQ